MVGKRIAKEFHWAHPAYLHCGITETTKSKSWTYGCNAEVMHAVLDFIWKKHNVQKRTYRLIIALNPTFCHCYSRSDNLECVGMFFAVSILLEQLKQHQELNVFHVVKDLRTINIHYFDNFVSLYYKVSLRRFTNFSCNCRNALNYWIFKRSRRMGSLNHIQYLFLFHISRSSINFVTTFYTITWMLLQRNVNEGWTSLLEEY